MGINMIPILSKYIYTKQSVFSGTGEERAESLMECYENPEIKNRYEWASKDILCVHQEAEGFTLPEWNGYPTEIC